MKISKLNGFHVNNECLKNKTECLLLISNLPKVEVIKNDERKDPQVLGNPASDFCSANKGSAEILHDKKNNEYEYCVLKEIYFVDAWDFYSLNKK
jgi:putative hemolysin